MLIKFITIIGRRNIKIIVLRHVLVLMKVVLIQYLILFFRIKLKINYFDV